MTNAPIKTNEEYSVSHCSVIVTVYGAPRLWKPVKLGSPSSSGYVSIVRESREAPSHSFIEYVPLTIILLHVSFNTYYVAHILLIPRRKKNAIYSRINSQKCGSSVHIDTGLHTKTEVDQTAKMRLLLNKFLRKQQGTLIRNWKTVSGLECFGWGQGPWEMLKCQLSRYFFWKGML